MAINIKLDTNIAWILVSFVAIYISVVSGLLGRILLALSRFTRSFFYGFDILIAAITLILVYFLLTAYKK